MSDVEKAISGSVDDEQRQQQEPLQYNTTAENLNTIPDNENLSVTILKPYTREEQCNTKNNHTKKYQLRDEKGNNYQKEYELTVKEDGKHYTHRKIQRRQQQQQQQQRAGTGGAGRATARGRGRGRGEEEGIQEDEEEEAEVNVRCCLGGIIKLFLSTPGLVALVVLYSIMGALIFPLLEAPTDINKSALIAKSREECLKELWIITEKLNVLYERNWTMLVHEQLRRFEGTIVAATRNNVIQQPVGASMVGKAQDSDISSSTTTGIGGSHGLMLTADSSNALLGYSAPTPDPLDYTSRWSFSEALLYSVTVITTIGQGSLTPRTAGGKIATILYALIGVPLMLMCLSSLGTLLADALQCTYARLCCRFAQCEVNTGVSNKATNAMAEKQASNNSKRKYHQRYMAAVITTNNDDDDDDDDNDDDKLLRQQKLKNVYHPVNNYNIQSQGSGSDYKTYKYDALLDASYYHREEDDDENYKQQLQPHTSHKQDACCRPWLNNGAKAKCQQYEQTACQQLKTPTDSTMRTQFQQQQQQQQQYRRDIMLTTEGHKLSSTPTMLRGGGIYTNTPAGVSIDGMGVSGVTHSLISSPQRYFAHPSTMATYHIVANAVNESNIRPLTHISNNPQQQQHFMTITSNALRFPDTTIKDTQRAATADAQLGMPKQQTATIYVPVITSNSSTTSTSSQSQNNNSSSDAMLSKSSFMKYQTIQLPEQASYGLTSYIANTLVNQQTIQQSRDEQEKLPPPPPAYQTTTATAITKPTASAAPAAELSAQQHGTLRRAKFLTKPLPPEINTLLHENDLYGNYDLIQQPLQQQQQQNTFFLSSVLQGSTPTELIVNTTLPTAVDIKSVETLLTTTTTTHTKTNTNNNNNFSNTSVSTGFVSDSGSTSTVYSVLLSTLVPTTITTITPTLTAPSTTTSVLNSYNNDFCSTSTLMPNNIHSYAIVTTTTATATTATSVSAAAATIACTNCKSNLVNKCESHESKATTTTTTTIPVATSALAPLYMNSHTQLHDCGPVMATDATLVLDITEDEDDTEQHQHLDNCPHGTPSRMPLLPTSSSTKLTTSAQATTLGASTIHDHEKRTFQFHRPNLTTFHRTNGILTQQQQQQQRNQLIIVPATVSVQQQQHFPCKSLIINRKGECNLHTPPPQPQRRASMSGLCYGNFRTADHTDTSEDEMMTLTNGQETYKLQNLQTDTHLDVGHDYELDNNSLVSLQPVLGIDDPQVPMSLVLLILIFYVCLGTIVFALWENWTLIDGAYFCFVTLTTIGYGDFLPARTFNGPQIQLFACCAYLLLGLVLVAMSFSVLETQLMWKCKRLAVRLKLAKD